MPAPINPQAFYANNAMGVGNGYQVPQYAQPTMYPQMANPYQQPQQQKQFIQMIPVRGQKEVENYPTVEPTYFFDAEEPVFYIKDATGLRIFDYKERGKNQNESTKVEYVTKEEFDKLYKLVDDLTSSK